MTEPVHEAFGLTYANYLVLPRSLMQSMPEDWQRRFVAACDELIDTFPGYAEMAYSVEKIDERYAGWSPAAIEQEADRREDADWQPPTVPDPLAEYRHGGNMAAINVLREEK